MDEQQVKSRHNSPVNKLTRSGTLSTSFKCRFTLSIPCGSFALTSQSAYVDTILWGSSSPWSNGLSDIAQFQATSIPIWDAISLVSRIFRGEKYTNLTPASWSVLNNPWVSWRGITRDPRIPRKIWLWRSGHSPVALLSFRTGNSVSPRGSLSRR